MSFLDRIHEANRCDPGQFIPFVICGRFYGAVRRRFARILSDWPDIFEVLPDRLCLRPDLEAASCEARSRALARVSVSLRQYGVIEGWRDELYPVCERWGADPVMLLERAAIPHFGFTAYGVHMNGYVGGGKARKMWIARRSLSKPTGPGKLDQLVAGGQPHGIGLRANMIKECAEEAGIPAELAARVHPAGTVSYVLEADAGLRPDVIYNFDLELPEEFRPRNTDGEVESFHCLPVAEVMDIVRSGTRFKFNCALVQIDFLIRHGHIPADHPDYAKLCAGLRPFAGGGLEGLLGASRAAAGSL